MRTGTSFGCLSFFDRCCQQLSSAEPSPGDTLRLQPAPLRRRRLLQLDHYDAFGRPIVYEYKKTGGVHEALLEYKYDYASNITWRYDDKMEGLGTPVY